MGKSLGKNAMASNPVAMKKTQDVRNVLARDQIQDWDDPNVPTAHYPDNTVCSRCGAIYHNQHWLRDDKQRDLLVSSGVAKEVVCPGCKTVEQRLPQGILTLSGDYWPQHREDVLNLIRNEEARGISDNPLERIIDLREEDGALIVETTTTKLAQRIGRAVHSAHKGDIEYQWPEGNNLVRIYWERSLAERKVA